MSSVPSVTPPGRVLFLPLFPNPQSDWSCHTPWCNIRPALRQRPVYCSVILQRSIFYPALHSYTDRTLIFFLEDKVWTVVHHNSTDPVKVRGSTPDKPHKSDLDYGASPNQLRALVSQSEHCQQTLTYQCRRSRLFNTWGESGLFFCSVSRLLLGTNEAVNWWILLPCVTWAFPL